MVRVGATKAPSAKVKKALKEEIVNVFGTDFGIKPGSLVLPTTAKDISWKIFQVLQLGLR